MKRKFGFSNSDVCQWVTTIASLATMVLAIMILMKLKKKEKFINTQAACVAEGQKDSNANWQNCIVADYNNYKVV
jgi:hypothetical protein